MLMSHDPVGPIDLTVRLGRLTLPNPILVASGTFGYAREMAGLVNLSRLGGMIPKTITRRARAGNQPWRTVETAAGLLNSIGLDNDGLDQFCREHLPYLTEIGCPLIVSIAGSNYDDFVQMAEHLQQQPGITALELNISCPNVSGGIDFGTDPQMCGRLVDGVRQVTSLPVIAKLTPNVTHIVPIAQAASEAGADAVSLINTLLGMAVNWRTRQPMLGNGLGGLSGPAIKPVALRCVHQVAQQLQVPIIGVGGIATLDDVMQFLVTGASAVQIGTANFYDPQVSMRLIDDLPDAIASLKATRIHQIVRSLQMEHRRPASPPAPQSSD
jgi:dihydroorotate dehydrogenase (NAD+) catalytic subunit